MTAEVGETHQTLSDPNPIHPLSSKPIRICRVYFLESALLSLAASALIVCCGYALSRASKAGALDTYYAGAFLAAITPIVFLYRNKKLPHPIGIWMSISIGLVSYIIAYCYSPLQFALSDEFQHTFTAHSILATHHLFHFNPALPVSSQFPGLEIVTTALSSLSGLSIFASGTIIAGVSHVIVTGLIFCVARELGLSPRAALFAVVIFTTGYDYQSFLSYFAYETFAVPFLIATLIMMLKMLKADEPMCAFFLGLSTMVLGFVTIVSHHVTSYFMILLLVILGTFGYHYSPVLQKKGTLIILVLGSIIGLLVFWDLAVATTTVHYLSQIRTQLFGGKSPSIALPGNQVAQHVGGGHAVAESGIESPPLRAIGDLGIVVFAVLIPIGAWTVWHDRGRYTRSLWAMPLISCVAYFALLPIFIFSSNGVGLVGRAQVLLLIPSGLVAAVALDRGPVAFIGGHARGAVVRLLIVAGTLAASIVALGGVPASYPPNSGKLPAPFNVDAYTRSADARTVEAGIWLASVLGPRARVAGDHSSELLFEAIAGVPVLPGVANLFESETFTPSSAHLVQRLNIQYVIGDYRLTTEIPAGGSNFDGDPLGGGYRRPLPRAAIAKFNAIPGVSRIFDDGTIVIYDLDGSRYYKRIHR